MVYRPTADALVRALNPGRDEVVLEIGPGKGILTSLLVKRCRRVVAVEIDVRLVSHLRQRFAGDAGLEIVHADILDYDLDSLGPCRIIGNLPYNVSSQVVFQLIDGRRFWSSAVLTVQREFAQRMVAAPGSRAYGAVSILLESVCERERLFDISPTQFRPRPRVISTAVRLLNRQDSLVEPGAEDGFRRLVKAAFGQRRKTLVNNLAAGLRIDKVAAKGVLLDAGIGARARAEELSIADFARLLKRLPKYRG